MDSNTALFMVHRSDVAVLVERTYRLFDLSGSPRDTTGRIYSRCKKLVSYNLCSTTNLDPLDNSLLIILLQAS
jgi:hypothetical protein